MDGGKLALGKVEAIVEAVHPDRIRVAVLLLLLNLRRQQPLTSRRRAPDSYARQRCIRDVLIR